MTLYLNTLGLTPTRRSVSLSLYVWRARRAGDVDFAIKAALDILQGYVYENDRQVEELHVFKRYDKADPRLEVRWFVV